MKVQINDGGYIPQRAHWLDAGADFRSCEDYILNPHDGHVFELNVAVQLPPNTFGYMASKSGLMVNHGVICLGGIIDAGFRGPIKVRMYNTSDTPYHIHEGDKLVQMVVIPCICEDFVQVVQLDSAPDGRNTDGWGSSGR